MKKAEVFKAWGRILAGRYPSLSIEITKECPLKCPGCYAYEPDHLGSAGSLRSLTDLKGRALVDGVLDLAYRYKPLHISIVGGEPLVRYRELNEILPVLDNLGIKVQLVTSAVRPIPAEWASLRHLLPAVSTDGLQPDHDLRRKPATYDRIIKNISGHRVTVHCTVTRQMISRPGYFREFLSFWSLMPEVKKFWFSLYTPQKGEVADEIIPAG